MITDVLKFHRKFNLPEGEEDELSNDPEAQKFRIAFMEEELREFADAIERGDRVKAFDALLDLAYVVHGTALFMGVNCLQWYEGEAAVQKANMSKERASNPGQSKRGTALDVVKPQGWVGPENRLYEILRWLK